MKTEMRQMVVLVDENDQQLGVCEKQEAHERGLLHRAFSIFVFDKEGKLLLQQRADNKYHSGGLWTNTCCSHPQPGEETISAAQQRLVEEMGFETELTKVFDFTYKTTFSNGLTEHELDHVYTGKYDGPVHPNPEEVKDYQFTHLYEIKKMIEESPEQFTSWFKIAFPQIENWWNRHFGHLAA